MTSEFTNEALVLLLDRLVSSSSSEDIEAALEKLLEYEGDLERLLEEPELLPSLQKLLLSDSTQVLAARMLLKLAQQKRSILEALLLHECRLLESAIDVASDPSSSNYARILALQLLQSFCKITKLAIPQWLSSPNGIHRIGDLLKDETVRTEALILGSILAQWPSVAKVWIFADIGNLVLETAIQEGGLTGGNLMVQDCLIFLSHLLSHDANSATLVFESPEIIPSFSRLIDLRLGKEYMNPTISDADAEDLDALLSNDTTTSKKRVIPKLLEAEEIIITKVIDIFSNVLENESLRNELSHKPIVTALWELALLDIGEGESPCAVPSSDLQCKAIALIAKHFNAVEILNRHGGLDRLLMLVCTRSEHSMVQAILYLIRSILPDTVLNEMLMECLAPSPDTASPASENVVRKLLITAMAQLDAETPINSLLIGSLSALGIFVANDEARRSILFRITSVEFPELWAKLMTYLQRNEMDAFLSFHVWRFLVVAMSEAIIAEMLQNADIVQYVIGSDADMAKFAIGMMILNLPDESLCGGWTRASLLQSVQPWNTWMKALERLKRPNETVFSFAPEEALWIDWCTEYVLKIRQCMVQEMTAGKGEEEDNPLTSIVEEQSNELKTLRTALETSQRRVEAQEKELATWEQRMQSNPTELDELLSASTAKISTLDAKIISLQDQLRDESAAHAVEINGKDSKIAGLDKRLAETEAVEAESRTECDTIREEMAALSEAYARLEDEYRATQDRLRQQEIRQTEGEESGQDGAIGSTEVATLRAENQRLIEAGMEAQAWMAMADQKITEQESELSVLQQQVRGTHSDNQHSSSMEELSALQEEVRTTRMQSEAELRIRDAKIEQLRSALSLQSDGDIIAIREENYRLNQEAEEAQKWITMAAERLETQEAELLAIRAKECDPGLSTARSGEEVVSLEKELTLLQEELASVRLQSEEYRETRQAGIAQAEPSSASDAEIKRLREANEAAETWMHDAYKHHQSLADQISRLTEENNALTDRCEKQQAELSNNQIRFDDQTSNIEELSEKLHSLREELESSSSHSIEELTKRCSALEAELLVEKQEVALLQSRSMQTTDAAESDKVAELEQLISSLKNETMELRSSKSELSQRVSDLETTQIEVGATKEEIEQLRIRAHDAESRKASIEKILEAVAKEKEELASESQKNQNILEDIQNELNELRRKEHNTTADSSTFGDELADLHEENYNLRKQMESKEEEANGVISEWQKSNEELRRRIESTEEERQELSTENERVLQDLHECRASLEEIKDTLDAREKLVAEYERTTAGLRSQVENLHEQLEDQENDNAEVLQGWQDAYNEAAAIGSKSQGEIETLEARLVEVNAELQKIRIENSETNQTNQGSGNSGELLSNQSAGEDPEARKHEVSSVHDLQDQIKTLQEESRTAILEWQDAYESKVAEIVELQNRLQELLNQSSMSQTGESPETRCLELESQLRAVQDERDLLVRAQGSSDKEGDDLIERTELLKNREELEQARLDICRLEQSLAELHSQLGLSCLDSQLGLSCLDTKDFEQQHNKALSAIEERTNVQAKYEEACINLETARGRLQEIDYDSMATANLSDQLEDQRKETEKLVLMWEESYNDVQSELDRLRAETDEEISNLRFQLESVRNDSSAYQDHNESGRPESNGDRKDWNSTEPHLDDNSEWKIRYDKLKIEMEVLRKQLEDQNKETEYLVDGWEQRYNELQSELHDMQGERNESTEDHKSSNASEVELLRDQLRETSEIVLSWQDSYDELKQERDEAMAQLTEKSAMLIKEQAAHSEQTNLANELTVKVSEFEGQIEEYKALLERWETAYNEVVEELGQRRDDEVSQEDGQDVAIESLRTQLREATNQIDTLLEEKETYEVNTANIEKLYEDREKTLNELKTDLEQAKHELQVKVSELDDAGSVVREWEASYDDVLSELERLQSVQAMGGEPLIDSTAEEKVGRGTSDEIERIEAVLQGYIDNESMYISKIKMLEQEQNLAREFLDKEVVYLAKIEALEDDIEKLRMSNAKESDEVTNCNDHSDFDHMTEGRRESNDERAQEIESLKHELQANKQHAESAVAEWELCYEEVSAQLTESEDQLSEAKALIHDLEEQLKSQAVRSSSHEEGETEYIARPNPAVQYEDDSKIKALEKAVRTLELEKEQDAEHARNAIGSWEIEYQALLEELEETQQWRETITTQEGVIAENARQISVFKEEIEELQQSLDRLLYEKSAFEAESIELRSQLSLRSSEVEQLRREISNRSEIETQQTTSDSFEARITDLLSTIQNLQHEVDMANGEKTSLEIRVASLDDNFKSQIEAAKSEISRTRDTLEAERAKDCEKLIRLEDALESMRREKASWEQECMDLRAEYSNLTAELEETQNSLRLTLTDKATSDASHAAASLMKSQLENLQSKLESIQQALAKERDAKDSAEAEATRLRSNIAALLGFEDNDENKTVMEQRLLDATDSLQRMERSEISALKDSLSRTLNELSEARSSEKKMEEKAASASHRANLYEAEVVNTKNDFNFLSRTLDDIRDSEASKISSLEFRLASLRNEHSVQTKIYAAELENLRNELSQSNLERDHLLQALNECESSRESISQLNTPDPSYGEDATSELIQLRIEKAQLLTAATAEASHTERRLRENRAMIKAAAEAEVIMERELRLAAERSLESAKAEVATMRSVAVTQPTSSDAGIVTDQLVLLQSQLDEARSCREKLEQEIDALQTQLTNTKRERDMDVTRMNEECQKLRVRINHVEREGRFEAQVVAEAARLKASESMTVAAPETKEEKSEEVIALWDHIEKLQDGIKKERTMYFEKKSEHDSLLALLARQDLMKETLSEALASLGGQEAVDSAIQEASDLASNHLSI